MPDYSRRQNTNNWQIRFARQTNRTDEILRRLNAPVESFNDLIERKNSIEQWLATASEELNSIYGDRSVMEEFNRPIADLILGQLNHAQVLEVLREVIEERLEVLNRIAAETRAREEEQR